MNKNEVIKRVESFNEESEYNLDANFYSEGSQTFVNVFNRFYIREKQSEDSDEGRRFDKVQTTANIGLFDESMCEEVVSYAQENGMLPEHEFRTSGDVNRKFV